MPQHPAAVCVSKTMSDTSSDFNFLDFFSFLTQVILPKSLANWETYPVFHLWLKQQHVLPEEIIQKPYLSSHTCESTNDLKIESQRPHQEKKGTYAEIGNANGTIFTVSHVFKSERFNNVQLKFAFYSAHMPSACCMSHSLCRL